MQLTQEQDNIKREMFEYLRTSSGDKPFVLAGSAGVGKTTVVSSFLQDLAQDPLITDLKLIAPTGKATSVLNKKQKVILATTAHSMLYDRVSSQKEQLLKQRRLLVKEIVYDVAADINKRYPTHPDKASLLKAATDQRDANMAQLDDIDKQIKNIKQDLSFSKRSVEDLKSNISAFICDEASMVGRDLAIDLSFGVPSIFIGDPKQLPPVNDTFGVPLNKPTAQLTKILRQKGDSGVLDLAYEVLKGRVPHKNWFNEYQDINHTYNNSPLDLYLDEYQSQFIVYYNDTRHRINPILRKHVNSITGDAPLITPGEILMLDKNLFKQGFTKGDLVVVQEISDKTITPRLTFTSLDGDKEGYTNATLHDLADSWTPGWRPNHFHPDAKKTSFQYPYCITCHKAQGSEYEHVVLFAENNNPAFLYTGVTRAKSYVSIVETYTGL